MGREKIRELALRLRTHDDLVGDELPLEFQAAGALIELLAENERARAVIEAARLHCDTDPFERDMEADEYDPALLRCRHCLKRDPDHESWCSWVAWRSSLAAYDGQEANGGS